MTESRSVSLAMPEHRLRAIEVAATCSAHGAERSDVLALCAEVRELQRRLEWALRTPEDGFVLCPCGSSYVDGNPPRHAATCAMHGKVGA